ncbi:MAG: YqhA family protein [candidate division NC10 bacterium]|nr:YqhA family protein [candidate division NC10 bacterium]
MSEEHHPRHGLLEEVFETTLFNCRFFVLVPVLGILVAAIVMFVKGCIEIVQGVRAFLPGLFSLRPNTQDDSNVILSFIPAIDNYLFATILLIISMGLYELFISKIDPESRTAQTRPDWLVVKNFDDLKSKIGEVVIMILIVHFFKLSFSIAYNSALDLLALGGGILLVAGSLVVTHYVSGMKPSRPKGASAA